MKIKKKSSKIITVIRLDKNQSIDRKRRRSMDIWPDVGRYNVIQALETIDFCTDPLLVSFFKDHRSAQVREAAKKKLQNIRLNFNEDINNHNPSGVEPDSSRLNVHGAPRLSG